MLGFRARFRPRPLQNLAQIRKPLPVIVGLSPKMTDSKFYKDSGRLKTLASWAWFFRRPVSNPVIYNTSHFLHIHIHRPTNTVVALLLQGVHPNRHGLVYGFA